MPARVQFAINKQRLIVATLPLILLVFWTSMGWAAPSITGVTGNFIKGQTVTISGIGFGTHADYDTTDSNKLNYAWADFEEGNSFRNGIAVDDGFTPDCADSDCHQDWLRMTSDNRPNSSYWAKRIDLHDSFACNIHGLKKPTDGSSAPNSSGIIFCSFYFKTPKTSSSGKFVRIADTSMRDLWLATGGSDFNLRGSDDNDIQWTSASLIGDQTWQRIDLLMRTSAGTAGTWIIGQNSNNAQWDRTWNIGLSNIQVNIGAGKDYTSNTATNYYGYDDIYIDFTQARCEICNTSTWSARTQCEIQIPNAWNADGKSIKINVNPGSFASGSSAYLYVVDSTGSANPTGIPITVGGSASTPPPTTTPHTVTIASPSTEDTYQATQSTTNISGTVTIGSNAIASISWRNDRGGSGTATDISGTWSQWSISGVSLQEGQNVITITATDSTGQTATDTITISYTSSANLVQAWDAKAQTGDSTWADSGVTYCARILVNGSRVTQSGNTIRLGFQGRSSGSYTIKSVSIAERDTNALEGDVVDSTWTKVLFDGNAATTWSTATTTVSAASEKLSDPLTFALQAGKDYYVTFKIVTPSIYLDPPSGYNELYFDTADHTADIDWSNNGHGTTQDFHAIAKIYVVGSTQTSVPGTPTGVGIN